MQLKGLAATTWIMCVMNLAGFVMVEWDSPSAMGQAIFYGFLIAVTYVVLWFYWKRKNWARVLVMLGAVISVVNLIFIDEVNLPTQIVIILEFFFGVYMLWWLNTYAVKAYFQAPEA